MTMNSHAMKSAVLAGGVVALLLFLGSGPALAGPTQTAQGIMVDLNAAGQFAIVNTQLWKFNVTTAGTYFVNEWDDNPPTVSTQFTGPNVCTPPTPATPPPPAPDSSKVTGPTGAATTQKCTFLDGGTLTGSSYTQTATATTSCTSDNKTRTRKDTFTYTYNVTPDTDLDEDLSTQSFGVVPFTAWDLVSTTGPDTASITITAKIAGESVVQSTKFPSPGKFSFSLHNRDGSSRVTNLQLFVNGVLAATPGSTPVENCPSCLPDDPGAVDFLYTTNAGSNGVTSLLKDGDARTILNTDVFPGNNDGGADGRALAIAVMDPVHLDLPPGTYTITLTGTVKGNNALSDINFSVTQTINIVTPGCVG
jgi:hypothetical protein